MSWTNRKKAEIFAHLEELGISAVTARDLCRTPASGTLSKNDGLQLINAASCTMAGVSLISSPWSEVVKFWASELLQVLPEVETLGARAELMKPWTAYALNARLITLFPYTTLFRSRKSVV